MVGAPDIKDTTRELSYKFVEALINIACPGYSFSTVVQDVSLTISQFFYSLDVNLDLESPKSISTLLETHAAYDEYLKISGFLQYKQGVKRGSIEIVFLIIRSEK